MIFLLCVYNFIASIQHIVWANKVASFRTRFMFLGRHKIQNVHKHIFEWRVRIDLDAYFSPCSKSCLLLMGHTQNIRILFFIILPNPPLYVKWDIEKWTKMKKIVSNVLAFLAIAMWNEMFSISCKCQL